MNLIMNNPRGNLFKPPYLLCSNIPNKHSLRPLCTFHWRYSPCRWLTSTLSAFVHICFVQHSLSWTLSCSRHRTHPCNHDLHLYVHNIALVADHFHRIHHRMSYILLNLVLHRRILLMERWVLNYIHNRHLQNYRKSPHSMKALTSECLHMQMHHILKQINK